MADDPTFYDDIECYPGQLSYQPGATVQLHVSTNASSFGTTVDRWGAGRETVWQADSTPGHFTPAPPDADANGCAWPVSLEFEIPDHWVSGFYLVTLTADGAEAGRDVAHAGFVVRAAEPTSTTLMVLATNTWNAYNN